MHRETMQRPAVPGKYACDIRAGPVQGQYEIMLRSDRGIGVLEELNHEDRYSVFFKLGDCSRAMPLRKGSQVFTTVFDEYLALLELHRIVPEFTPRPMGVVSDMRGARIGYFMDKVHGARLSSATGISEGLAFGIMADLMEYVARIHTRGMAHGDLTSQNVILDSRIKVIDPAGYHNSSFGIGSDPAASSDMRLFMGLVSDDVRDLRSAMRSLRLMKGGADAAKGGLA